jgi:hypothetical protein
LVIRICSVGDNAPPSAEEIESPWVFLTVEKAQ